MGVPSTWTERHDSREWYDDVNRGDTVIWRWDTSASHAAIARALPAYSRGPGTKGGLFAPVLQHRRVLQHPTQTGMRIVEAIYSPPSWRAVLERNPGKARLLADVSEIAIRPRGDLDEKMVWGEKTIDGVRYRFEPISGSGLQHLARTMLRLQVAASEGVLGTILALHDSTNAAATSFGAGAGTLRLAGAHTETVASSDAAPLTFLDAIMEYNRNGWNKDTVVGASRYEVRQEAVLDASGTAVSPARTHNVGVWVPATGADATRVVRLYKDEGWSALNKVIIWT